MTCLPARQEGKIYLARNLSRPTHLRCLAASSDLSARQAGRSLCGKRGTYTLILAVDKSRLEQIDSLCPQCARAYKKTRLKTGLSDARQKGRR